MLDILWALSAADGSYEMPSCIYSEGQISLTWTRLIIICYIVPPWWSSWLSDQIAFSNPESDVVWRVSRLRPWPPSWILELNDLAKFWFGFYGSFKNISFISSRSFIKDGRKPENPGKKTNWPSVSRTWLSHMWPKRGSNHSGEKPNGLRVTLLSTRLRGPAI